MSIEKLLPSLNRHVQDLRERGIAKGKEHIITGFRDAEDGFGVRLLLQEFPGRAFLRMNANSYLGLERDPRLITAETNAAERFGVGPGAVRFISGSFLAHCDLERKLADFHGRQAAMLFSSAYAGVIGVLPALIDADTLVVSDALNHNCIINAIRLSKTEHKAIYPHLDMDALERILMDYKGRCRRVCVVSDGVFSMRGNHAPLQEIVACCRQHEADYSQGIITIIDDSHGVGASGDTGRGTEQVTGVQADILIATLGKAFAVNGGYVVARQQVIDYLRETAVSYIYSNPITPAEAAAATAAVNLVDSEDGWKRIRHIRKLAVSLRTGIKKAGYETLDGTHPIVPVLLRDTALTSNLVGHLFDHDILATGLNYPVVAKGEQEIRLQVSADHTVKDSEYFLSVLAAFR